MMMGNRLDRNSLLRFLLATLALVHVAGSFGCTGGGSSATPLSIIDGEALNGDWRLSFKTVESSCLVLLGAEKTLNLSFTYDRKEAVMQYAGSTIGGKALYLGNTLRAHLSYSKDGGQVESDLTIAFSDSGHGSGAEKWTWTKGASQCSGTDVVSCSRVANLSSPQTSEAGSAVFLLTIDENDVRLEATSQSAERLFHRAAGKRP